MTWQSKDSWRRAGAGVIAAARVIFDAIPFVGRMQFANGQAWTRTALQTGASIFLSTLPVWAAVAALLFKQLEPTPSDAFSYAIKNGELFLLSSSAASPLLFIVSMKVRDQGVREFATSFPHGLWYLVSCVGIIVLCSIFLTIRVTDGYQSTFEPPDITALSVYFYLFSVFLFFTANFHKNSADSVEATDMNRPGENAFGRKWSHRDD